MERQVRNCVDERETGGKETQNYHKRHEENENVDKRSERGQKVESEGKIRKEVRKDVRIERRQDIFQFSTTLWKQINVCITK